MELTSVFNFTKSREAFASLEKLLWCKYCKNLYKAPHRDVYSGNVACVCQKNGKKDLTPDWFLNNIVEAAGMIGRVINGNSEQMPKDDLPVDNTGEIEASGTKRQINANKQEDCFKIPSSKPNDKKKLRTRKNSINTKERCLEDKISSENTRLSTEKRQESTTSFSQDRYIMQPTRKLKEIMKRNTKGETKLHTACVKGDKKKVEEFLAAGASPCTKDYAGWTPLHEAVSKGHNNIVKMLLEAGAMANVPGGYNNTPLHDAALNDNLEAARLLIAHGANPDARNIQGFTPRTMAQTEEMKSILKEYFPLNISKRLHSCISQSDVILYGLGLNSTQQAKLTMMARHFKMKQVNAFSHDITHMVVTAPDRKSEESITILRAVLRGKWIVNSEWVVRSLEVKQIVDCTEHELAGTVQYPESCAPRKARENAERMKPSIFNGCYFFLSGGERYSVGERKISKAELSTLITSGDGVVLTREPDPEAIPEEQTTVPYHANPLGSLSKCSHYIIYQPGNTEPRLKYNMPHVKSLPVTWLLKCIETFSLMETF